MQPRTTVRPMVRQAGRLHEARREKIRFLAVGVCNAAWSYGLFIVLLALLGGPIRTLSSSAVPLLSLAGSTYYVVVQWLTWALSVPPNALSMKHLVFRSKGDWRPQVVRAYFVYLPAQALSAALILVMVRVVHLGPVIGQLVTALLVMIVTYIGHKHFTFRTPAAAPRNRTRRL